MSDHYLWVFGGAVSGTWCIWGPGGKAARLVAYKNSELHCREEPYSPTKKTHHTLFKPLSQNKCFFKGNTTPVCWQIQHIVYGRSECTYFLSSECVLQGGGAVELQGRQGGEGVRQCEGGQTKRAQADPSSLFQAAHQRTETSHDFIKDCTTLIWRENYL